MKGEAGEARERKAETSLTNTTMILLKDTSKFPGLRGNKYSMMSLKATIQIVL